MSSVVLEIPANKLKLYSLYGDNPPQEEKLHGNYYPLPLDRYIVLSRDNEYKYWPEVFELVAAELAKNKINLVDISKLQKTYPNGLIPIRDATVRQAVNILENAKLIVCGQDWVLGICEKNNYDYVCVNTKSKSSCHNYKKYDIGISELKKPELVAKAILSKLGLNDSIVANTELIGDSYGEEIIEIIPDIVLQPEAQFDPNKTYGIRCDLCPNWNFVMEITKRGVIPFVRTTRLPPRQIIPFIKGVRQLVIFINEKINPKDLQELKASGINFVLLAYNDNKKLDQLKARFFDFDPIVEIKPWGEEKISTLKKLPFETYIKTKRLLVSSRGTFASIFHYKNNIVINSTKGSMLLDAWEDKDFLRESDLFLYYTKHE